MKKVLDMDSAKKRLDFWKTAIVMEIIIASIVLGLQGWKAYNSYSYYKYKENEVNEYEEERENSKKYEFNRLAKYSGESTGTQIQDLLNSLVSKYSNQKSNGYPNMTLIYINEKNESKEYMISEENCSEIKNIRNELDIKSSHKYKVSVKYNDDGYVNYIEISYNI